MADIISFQQKQRSKTERESYYADLLACYQMGQIPESAWQEHLSDQNFKTWLIKQEAMSKA